MEAVAMTRQQMADNYEICPRTLNKWFKEKGITLPRGLISPKDQENIYSKIGYHPNHKTRIRVKKL
jgi:hypothetical protein